MSSDEELVERARGGDREAFRALFLAHHNATARLLARLVPLNEVEDVTQEVFLQVYRSLTAFRGEARFSTWLYRLTMNVARMHLRRQKSRPKLTLAGGDEAGHLERPEHDTPQREAERNERLRALDRLLAELSEKKREALVLHDFQGVSAEEIARILEVPVMTVRTRLFYARRELYAALEREPVLAALVQALVGDGAPHSAPGREAEARAKPVEARVSAREQNKAEPASAEAPRALAEEKP